MKKIKRRKNRILREYGIYAHGVDKKLALKSSVMAESSEDAEKKGKLFSKVAGITFSHTKLINHDK